MTQLVTLEYSTMSAETAVEFAIAQKFVQEVPQLVLQTQSSHRVSFADRQLTLPTFAILRNTATEFPITAPTISSLPMELCAQVSILV